MNHKNRLSFVLLPSLILIASLSACDNRQEQAQSAYADYQAAVVGGDLREVRRALAKLVAADDSNADYWVELGKVCMQLSDYGAAYDAFQRAHELNRSNVEVLSIMTQLALRGGNLEVASDNARQLELVAPTNSAVPLTKGYVALRRGDFEEADRQVAAFAALAPFDPNGKVLQSRILMAQGRREDAITLLSSQITQQPSDAMSLRALASIYELKEDWPQAASALRSYLNWQPTDQQARVRLVEAELRSGAIDAAAAVTLKGVEKDDIDVLLAPWIALGLQDKVADRLFTWAQSADTGRRIAIARFLTFTAQPARVLSLIEKDASLPVRPANIVANAIYGTALVQSGRARDGLSRLDAVLQVDGKNREALRARALLRSRAGQHEAAIEDAQKLVAADRNAPSARLLMARVYAASGDTEGARRTLWEAFHDIGGDRTIYDALKPLVAKSDGADAAQRLSQEFYDKRNEQITRSFA
ncbi:Flp pilus assembly protein TadD [Sphingomonas kaistensis]|uniref:Flp pilus assembly protein TadD n=1 Tax=Sphingomonas kaistensis TaxID=298708 RepID=A0A7X6BEP4_9SPHN|nr:tetratricopeptide repeat protein [Sphingomonas kaistensis]NJC04494.1 Flp pilus assembly protein TadD [Sphingomonas kaistensis]